MRVEDIDPPREIKGASQAILQTLAQLALVSDAPVLYQHTRIAVYEAEIERLLKKGLAFECRCSRRDLAPSGIHRGRCSPLAARRAPSIRFLVPAATVGFEDRWVGRFAQALHEAVGDVVLRRADGLIAYQLAVVVDDAYQSITDIVRGRDLLDSTPRQIALGAALGYPPLRYLHVPVVCGEDGQKLSKQRRAEGVDASDALAVLNQAARHLGLASAATDDVAAALAVWTAQWRDQNAQLVVST